MNGAQIFQFLALLSAFNITEKKLHSVFQELNYKLIHIILY
jgi:hypothetical protein